MSEAQHLINALVAQRDRLANEAAHLAAQVAQLKAQIAEAAEIPNPERAEDG